MAKCLPVWQAARVTAWPAVHSWHVRLRPRRVEGRDAFPATLWIRYWKGISSRLAHQLRYAASE